MSYLVAVPSYKRAQLCNLKTLTTLHAMGINPNLVHVFVVPEEFETYKEALDADKYSSIIAGRKGLVDQRDFICNYFPEGSHIVFLDDDIERIDLSFTDYPNLHAFFLDAFDKCVEYHSNIFGVYPVYNPYFREKRTAITTGLSYIVGAFYGIINTLDECLNLTVTRETSQKEDVERSLLYWLDRGVVVRFNRVGFKTKYYGTDGGGLGKFSDRLETMKVSAINLHQKYPELTRIKIRKSGMYEVVLRVRRTSRSI